MMNTLISLVVFSFVSAAEPPPWIVGKWAGTCIPMGMKGFSISHINTYRKDGTGTWEKKYFKDLHCKTLDRSYKAEFKYAVVEKKGDDVTKLDIRYDQKTVGEVEHVVADYQKFGKGLGDRLILTSVYLMATKKAMGDKTPAAEPVKTGLPQHFGEYWAFTSTRE